MRRLLAMALVDKQQVALPDSTLGEVSAFQQIWSSVTQLEMLVFEMLVFDWAADRDFEPAINAAYLEPVCKPVDSSDAGNTWPAVVSIKKTTESTAAHEQHRQLLLRQHWQHH